MDYAILLIALVLFIGMVVSWFLLPSSALSTATVTETETMPTSATA